jgi:N-acetylglucosamine kinase-like BadF-type ATPase
VQYVIGVDGGGTKTAAVVMDLQGHVLGAGEGGPSTYGIVRPDVTRASIAEAAAAAARAAGCSPRGFSAAFLGLGNVVSAHDRAAVRQIAAALGLAPTEMIGVDHDCRVALAGALPGRPGMVMIAGTGTACFGMNAAGLGWRAGGWGPLIDDEGSSYWMGIQAMRAAVLASDGRGSPTLLASAVLRALDLPAMDDLMNRLYADGMTRTEIAALAPLVFAAAAQGDQPALELIRAGCAAMADCCLAAARQIGLDDQPCELAVVGGLTNTGDLLLAPFREAIRARLPLCTIRQAELPPAVGAALLALQHTGQPVNPTILSAARQSTAGAPQAPTQPLRGPHA